MDYIGLIIGFVLGISIVVIFHAPISRFFIRWKVASLKQKNEALMENIYGLMGDEAREITDKWLKRAMAGDKSPDYYAEKALKELKELKKK